MKQGFLVYKCRKCGNIVKNTHVPDVDTAIILIVSGNTLPEKWGGTARIIDIHSCEDGSIGVSDLIGGEPTNK